MPYNSILDIFQVIMLDQHLNEPNFVMNLNLEDSSSSEGASSDEVRNVKEPARKKEKKPFFDPSFEEFRKKIDSMGAAEDKINLAIEYMRNSLSQEGSPRFKEFWETRRLCLLLFKEGMNSVLRNQLWSQFIELTSEALRLREILSEQASFAVEQIELAIQSLEEDLKNYDRLLSDTPPIALPHQCQSLAEKMHSYTMQQRELNLLGAIASRINSLRKEVLKTEMRLRDKSRFFKRLSEGGDRVFPRRKELIEKISDDFLKDVEAFIAAHFSGGNVVGAPLYILREEIKALQGIAKTLTLNSHSFTQTRVKLSECWDIVKTLEKERKKEIASKKQAQQQNKILFEEKIKEFSEKASALSFEDKKRGIDELFKSLRNFDFQREDFPEIRKALENLKTTFLIKEAEKEKKPAKNTSILPSPQISAFKERLQKLLQSEQDLPLDELENEYFLICSQIEKSNALKDQFEEWIHELRSIQDSLLARKENTISEENPENLSQLLELKKQIRHEIKTHLENFRKRAGGSGFDFEKGMIYREIVDLEKERLLKIDESIQLLEERIAESE